MNKPDNRDKCRDKQPVYRARTDRTIDDRIDDGSDR
jgi:hypothetical protein